MPTPVGLKPPRSVARLCAMLGAVVGCGGAAYFFGDKVVNPAPPGWVTVSDAEGRYRICLPAQVTTLAQAHRDGQVWPTPRYPGYYAVLPSGGLRISVECQPIAAGATVPVTPEEHQKLSGTQSPEYPREKLAALRLAGRLGAEMRSFRNEAWMDDIPHRVWVPDWLTAEEKRGREIHNRMAEAHCAAGRADRERKVQEARATAEHIVIYLVATSERLYVIVATTTGGYADEGVLATLRNSFVIR